MQIADFEREASPWPHRWAVVLACATFPLVWVGGLVTTTKAGMAVPDWPSTYGYNLLLYPWTTWLAGPWDLFVEHGHRLLAATAGMVTIALVIAIWRADERRWLRWMALAALALVILQGILGGMRVLMDDRTFALVHGCTGPLFFGVTVALTVLTSRAWRSVDLPAVDTSHLRQITVLTCSLVYAQVVVGAVLRHIPLSSEPATFAGAVRGHLSLAAVLLVVVALLAFLVLRSYRHIRPLRNLAIMLMSLVLAQLALGAATWFVKYSIPYWASGWISAGHVAIQDGSWLQTHVVTAHVALGSLILATSVALCLYSRRLLAAPQPLRQAQLGRLEARA